MGARYYVPETGSWLSYDPIWNDRDPSGFTYCGGDPINRTDSNGKLSKQNSINSVSSPFYAPSAPYITSDSFIIPQIDLSKSWQSGNYDSSIPSMGPANPYSTGSPINSGYQSAPNPFTTDALTIGMGNVSDSQRHQAASFNANLYVNTLAVPVAGPGVGADLTLTETGVTVYRVEGLPNTRVLINEGGQVTVQGDQMLFVNFGDKARAEQFLTTRVDQGMPGAQMKSFQVPQSFVTDLQQASVPESMAKQFPTSPILVDATKAPNQFGLRPEQIQALQNAIIQGTGKTHP